MTDISQATVELPSVEDAAAMGTDTSVTPEPVAAEPAAEGLGQEPVAETYTVNTVNGEEQVTLEQLQQGYLRQADYTQKTQDLATQRRELAQAQALAEALDRDPQRTLQLLQEAYQVQPATQDATPFEEMDPLEQRMVRLEQAQAQAQREAMNRQIDADIAQLKATHGPDVDVDAVIATAVQHQIPLEMAYRHLNFEKAQQTQQIVEQKRAAQVVQGAGTTQRGAVSAPPKAYGSIREAALAALRQHGVAV